MSNLAISLETLRYSLIIFSYNFFQSGVKFSSDTKEFTVSISGKGNAVFNMEKKVKTKKRHDFYVVIT